MSGGAAASSGSGASQRRTSPPRRSSRGPSAVARTQSQSRQSLLASSPPLRSYAVPLTAQLAEAAAEEDGSESAGSEPINRAERPVLSGCVDGLELTDTQFEADFVLVLSWLKRLGMEKYIQTFWYVSLATTAGVMS